MTTWLSRSLLLLVASACAAVALAGRAQAEPDPNSLCMLMTADVTLSLPLNGPKMWAGSGTTFYADRILCPWLIVDYWAPAGPGNVGFVAKPATPCKTSVQMLMYMKPPFSSDFIHMTGDASGPSMTCSYEPSAGSSGELATGFFGIRRWRVLTRAWGYPPLSPKVPAPVFVWGLAESYPCAGGGC